jgi:hypothetical protein
MSATRNGLTKNRGGILLSFILDLLEALRSHPAQKNGEIGGGLLTGNSDSRILELRCN